MDAFNEEAGKAPATSIVNWLSVISVAFGTFVMVTTEFLPIGLLSRIAQDLGVTEGTAGLMVSTPGVVAAVAAPVAAFGLQGVNRRWMLLTLMLLVLVSNLIAAWSQDFASMLIARVLLGAAVGGFWAFAAAVGRRLVAERHGGAATAIVLAGISVGTVLGLPLGTLVGNWAGWRTAFEVGAALSAVALLAQSLLLPSLTPQAASSRWGWASMLRVPMLRTGFGFAFMLVLGHFAAYTYLEPYLTQQSRLGAGWLSVALCAYGVAGFIGNFVGAHFAERRVQATFRMAAALLALSVLALALVRAQGLVILAVIGWGLAFGATPACIQMWLYRADPALFEASSAFMVTVFQMALASGSWIGGMTTDRFSLHETMLAGAGFAGLSALAMLAYRTQASLTASSRA